jgi:hypothetical protein
MFSSVRDGFYSEKHNEVLRVRKASSSSMRGSTPSPRGDFSRKASHDEFIRCPSPISLGNDEAFSSQDSTEDNGEFGGESVYQRPDRFEFGRRRSEKENGFWQMSHSHLHSSPTATVDSNGLLMPPPI